jgi:hypothetical protein
MTLKFTEALEALLDARDNLHRINEDRNNPHWMRKNAAETYEEKLRILEEAHKISLLDVIAQGGESQ